MNLSTTSSWDGSEMLNTLNKPSMVQRYTWLVVNITPTVLNLLALGVLLVFALSDILIRHDPDYTMTS